MFSKIIKTRRTVREPRPEVPVGQRIYAIGDIHGQLDLLDALIAMIDADDASRVRAETSLIFLGDLVDRGPDSSGVVERLIDTARARPATRFLLGNHEEVFLQAVSGDIKALKFFCRIGGRETILSYGVSALDYDRLDFSDLVSLLRAKVPASHTDFLAGFEDVVAMGDYVFVHAGVRPGAALADQKSSDLRWIRDVFLDHRDAFERFVVHGHTITPDVDERTNWIGIDTGAYATGKLTALGLEGAARWLLQTTG